MFIVSVCKSFSTVWAQKSFIHQETYEHKITQNLTNYMPQLSLIANYKNSLDSIMKQLSLPYWYLTSTYSSQHINNFLHEYAYFAILHSNTPNKNYKLNSKITMQNPYCICRLQFIINVCILLCLRYSRCNSKLLSKINVFCLHNYFNFLLKASWTHNLFHFLSIFKSLQVKIEPCFSSQALPISFIQHSTTMSNYWLKW